MEEKRSKIKDLLKEILSNGGYVIGLVFICTLIIVAVINLEYINKDYDNYKRILKYRIL